MTLLLAASLYPPETRGPATFARQLVEHLERQKISVSVVPFREVRAYPPGIRHFFYFVKLLWRGRGVSLILALDPVSAGLPALFAARLLRVPLVVRLGGDYAWEQGVRRFNIKETLDEFVGKDKRAYPFSVRILWGLERFVAKRADMVVVPSQYLKRIILAWGVAPEHLTVIYSAATPASPSPSLSRAEIRQRVGWRDEPVIFSLGELVPWKGFPALIDAVATLRKDIPDIRLIIVGGGRQEALREHAKSRGLDPQAIFLGELSNTIFRELLRAADIFALNTGYEGLSHVLIEAMHAEVPIVTTPVGGNPELIEHGKTGLLVPFNDTEALARAMRELILNKRRAHSLALAARKAAEVFTPEKSMRAWERLIKKICES